MNDWQRRRPHWLEAAIGVMLIAAVSWCIVALERQRSRRLLEDSVKRHQAEDGRILGVRFTNPTVTAQQWELVEGVDTLVSIDLSGTTSVAGGLAPVAAFKNLHTLNLSSCEWVDDEQLARIATLKPLCTLDLSGTRITDSGVKQLDLSGIEWLIADGCTGLTDATLELLRQIKPESRVSLRGVDFSFDTFELVRRERPDLTILRIPRHPWIHRLSEDRDIAQFIRHLRLPHDWQSGRFEPAVQVAQLRLSGPGTALPQLFAAFSELESLWIEDATTVGCFDQLPHGCVSLTLNGLHADSRFDGIEAVTWLKSLSLRNCNLSDEEAKRVFAAIAANMEFSQHSLTEMDVPAGTLTTLEEQQQLSHISLNRCHISNADLHAIGSIPSLERIAVSYFPIDDAIVETWLDLPNVGYVELYETGNSLEIYDKLCERYPKAHIRVNASFNGGATQ